MAIESVFTYLNGKFLRTNQDFNTSCEARVSGSHNWQVTEVALEVTRPLNILDILG